MQYRLLSNTYNDETINIIEVKVYVEVEQYILYSIGKFIKVFKIIYILKVNNCFYI